MMMKNKFFICSVVIIVLTACIICTGCTSTQSAQTTLPTIPPSITTTSQPPSPSTDSMEQTTAPTAIPEPLLTHEVPSSQPAFTSAPGDPSSVLVSYPDLFNTGNGAGLFALLSENMKLHYPIDTLNNELAAARSNGYSIEKVQVNNQIIEENTAIVEVDISWKVAGSPVTSTPRFFLVYENDQWKLDSLIVSPQNS
jgi:hypothetical protein